MTHVVTDGAADLPAETAEALGIRVVRGPVRLGEQPWHGDLGQFWSEIGKERPLPATDAPSVAELAAAYGGGGEPVLAVHVSSELSRTCAHAEEAAAQISTSVRIVDSRSLSVGTGLLALAAAEAVRSGAQPDQLGDSIESWVDQLHLHAVIDDVNFLVHGGRAGLVAAKVGRHTHRHVIAVKGHVIPIREVRHRADAIHELIDHVRDHVGSSSVRWAVGHGNAADVGEFVERLASVFGCEPAYVTLLGAPVGSHMGPGSLAVGFLSDA